jgi:accessory colonization factor AcfC
MRTASALFSAITFSHMAFAQETLFAYGSGGPAPAMKEAAIAF